ncbi:hypothetical protein K502DRAFT_323278 [Neoconidiobolus thromboides FSU 785]|nr:hypothetical protein K502DRAFT_323278 [Neoconidiobolus thromboides FSU 785]
MDPDEFFKQSFGGEAFYDIIGEIYLAKDFKKMMNNPEEEGTVEEKKLTKEEQKKKDEEESSAREEAMVERIEYLTGTLLAKIRNYIEGDVKTRDMEFRKQIELEVEDLKVASFGTEILKAVGTIYSQKATRYLESLKTPKLFSYFKETGHYFGDAFNTFNDTVSAIKSTAQLQRTGDLLMNADKEGIDMAKKSQLEEEFAQKGLDLIWMGSRIEVQGVIRRVCDKILSEDPKNKEEIRLRAMALNIIGEIYKTADLQKQ